MRRCSRSRGLRRVVGLSAAMAAAARHLVHGGDPHAQHRRTRPSCPITTIRCATRARRRPTGSSGLSSRPISSIITSSITCSLRAPLQSACRTCHAGGERTEGAWKCSPTIARSCAWRPQTRQRGQAGRARQQRAPPARRREGRQRQCGGGFLGNFARPRPGERAQPESRSDGRNPHASRRRGPPQHGCVEMTPRQIDRLHAALGIPRAGCRADRKWPLTIPQPRRRWSFTSSAPRFCRAGRRNACREWRRHRRPARTQASAICEGVHPSSPPAPRPFDQRAICRKCSAWKRGCWRAARRCRRAISARR